MDDGLGAVDSELLEIGTAIIARSQKSDAWYRVFGAFWKQQIDKLAMSIGASANDKVFSVRCQEFTSSAEILFDAVSAEPVASLKDVWTYERGERLFDDIPWREYFQCAARYVWASHIQSFAVLLVVENSGILADERLRHLFRYFKGHEAYACRWLPFANYLSVQRGCGFEDAFVDFAIYGANVVFQTTSYQPAEGAFIGGRKRVGAYERMFDALWARGEDTSHLVAADEPVSLEELIEFDRLY